MRLAAHLLNRLLAFRWMASIFLLFLVDACNWLAFRPISMRHVFNHQDKYLHMLGFFGLACTGHVVLHFDIFPRIRRFHIGLYGLNAAVWLSYGVFIEGMQTLLTYRSGSMADYLSDLSGLLAGMLFVATLKLYRQGAPPDGTR